MTEVDSTSLARFLPDLNHVWQETESRDLVTASARRGPHRAAIDHPDLLTTIGLRLRHH